MSSSRTIGAIIGAATLIFFMALVILSILGYEVPPGSRMMVIIALALGCGLSANFLGGSAAAKGDLPFPLAKEHPITFGVTGGIAVVIIVLVLGFFLYIRPAESTPTAEEYFSILEDETKPANARLQALRELRDHHGIKDFKARNLSGLTLPKRGWDGVDFTEARFRNVDLTNAKLRGAVFVRADLSEARCSNADFRESQLNGAVMVNSFCYGAFFESIYLRAGRYNGANFENADFSHSWMQIAEFRGCNFKFARLTYAILDESDITNAVFRESDLTGASLIGVVGIQTADFTGAIYSGDTHFPSSFNPSSVGMIRK